MQDQIKEAAKTYSGDSGVGYMVALQIYTIECFFFKSASIALK